MSASLMELAWALLSVGAGHSHDTCIVIQNAFWIQCSTPFLQHRNVCLLSHITPRPRRLRVSIGQPMRVELEGQTNTAKVRHVVQSGPPRECRPGEVGGDERGQLRTIWSAWAGLHFLPNLVPVLLGPGCCSSFLMRRVSSACH